MLTKTPRFISVQIALVLLVTVFISMPVHAKAVMAENEVQAADGDLDSTFETGGIVTTDFNTPYDFGSSVVLQPDGKIVVGGETAVSSGNFDFALARYMPDGSLDTTFGINGRVTTDFNGQSDEGYAVALQADGKILLAGYTWNQASNQPESALARFNSNGSLDITFDMDGKVITSIGQGVYGSDVAVQPDGKIVIVGEALVNNGRDFALVRYNSNGSLDTGFGVNGITMTDFDNSDGGYAVVVQPSDGKMIVAGYSVTADNIYIALARYNSNGSLDTTFDNDGKVITSVGRYDHILDLALQADGKILAAGTGENINGSLDFMLVRYNSNGSLDTTFDSDGKVMTDFGSDEDGRAVAVQPDGRILMAGGGNSRTTLTLARYLSNGSLDPGFGINGKVTTSVPDKIVGYDLVLQPDHNIIVVGVCCNDSNVNFMVARYINHSGPRTFYVNGNATGANNGTSWTDAYTDLQSALAAANSGDEIWVAQGTYKPTIGTDRSISFVLKNGVKILGGFLGWEWEPGDPRNSERDPVGTPTILSGDIGTEGQKSDNSFHVVVASGVDSETVLDGLIITLGNATGEGGSDSSYGGGIYSYKSSLTLDHVTLDGNYGMYGGGMYVTGDMYSPAAPALTNVTFNANAAGEGGGMYIFEYSSPILKKVVFSSNMADRSGGGMMSMTYTSPGLSDVTFSGNTAGLAAGGMGNFDSQASLINVTFKGNSALSYGGAIVNASGAPTFLNVTISENSAAWGGGMWNSGSHPTLTNVTFEGNTASTSGGGIYSEADNNLTVRNTILWGNTAPTGAQIREDDSISTFSDSVVQGGFTGGTNIITDDPRLGPLGMSGGFTETVPLQAGSSAINAGNDEDCPTTDQRGVKRPQGSHCDIGAYEAGSLIVTKTADTNDGFCDSDCSLREAIDVAPAAGTINFSPSLSGQTISLGATLLIYKDLSIDGSALASRISVSGNEAFTVFETTPGATATLNSLTVINGRASGSLYGEGYSGGINNFGTLKIINSTISHNGSDLSEQGNGGGIFNSGSLNITGSIIANNFAHFGGGICNSGDLTIQDSTISDNEGLDVGGILNWGTLTVTNTTISNNSSSYEGGGVQNQSIINISNSTISGNKAGYNGGGLSTNGETRIINSTFFNNSAALGGGGIFGNGSLTIVNSTISGNAAGTVGGGIHNMGSLNMTNTILANSTSGSDCYNDASTGVIGVNVKNLMEGNAAAPNHCGTPALSSDPLIGAPASNGGSTQTMALQLGSPAIDAGTNAGCPATDQRGVRRPQGERCDIGAFEYESSPIPTELIITSDSPDPSEIEGWVTVSVVVSNIGEGAAQPMGVVHITGADANCDMTLNHGTGSCDVRFDTAGDKIISAFYEGDDSHLASSNDQPHRVQIWPTTLAILSDLPDPSVTNKPFTLAVRVTGGRVSPTGTVTVAGYGVSCTIPLTMGKGSCLLSFSSIGQKMLTAIYNGDSLHLPSMDTEFHQVIQGTPTVPPPPTFADVPVTHPYYQDIEILYANGLTGGCATSPLKFCPDQSMNRGQAAVFILRANFGSRYVPPMPKHIFLDDWSKGTWAEGWAEGMRNKGLSAGCSANPLKYCPWDLIPREQAVIFALRMKYGTRYTPPPAKGTVFADMTDTSYYATSWTEQAYKDGLIPNCGMSGGKPKICPKDPVSRGLAAYMIVRAKNLTMP